MKYIFPIAILTLLVFSPILHAQITSVTGENYILAAQNFTFDRDLTIGATGQDVQFLQCILNVAPVTAYFGPITKKAVVNFQNSHREEILTPAGLTEGTGFVGPSTRAYLNEQLSQRGGSGSEGGCQLTDKNKTGNGNGNKVNGGGGNGGGGSGGSSGSQSGATSGQNQQSSTQQNNDAWLLAYLLSTNRSPSSAGLGGLGSGYGNNVVRGEQVYPPTSSSPSDSLPNNLAFQPGSTNPTLGPASANTSCPEGYFYSSYYSNPLYPNDHCVPNYQDPELPPDPPSSTDNGAQTTGTTDQNTPPSPDPTFFGGTTLYSSVGDFQNAQYVPVQDENVLRSVPLVHCGCSPTSIYMNNNEANNGTHHYDPVFLIINNDSHATPRGVDKITGACVIGHFDPISPENLNNPAYQCKTPYQHSQIDANGNVISTSWQCENDRDFPPQLIQGVVRDMSGAQGSAYGACQSNPS